MKKLLIYGVVFVSLAGFVKSDVAYFKVGDKFGIVPMKKTPYLPWYIFEIISSNDNNVEIKMLRNEYRSDTINVETLPYQYRLEGLGEGVFRLKSVTGYGVNNNYPIDDFTNIVWFYGNRMVFFTKRGSKIDQNFILAKSRPKFE